MKTAILRVLGIAAVTLALAIFATVPPAAGSEAGSPEGEPAELQDGSGREAGRGQQDGSGQEAGRGQEDGSGREAGRGQQDGSGRDAGRGQRDGQGRSEGRGQQDGSGGGC